VKTAYFRSDWYLPALYDDEDVLKADHVNPANGYRYYRLDQMAQAELVKVLRQLEVPVVETRDLVSNWADSALIKQPLRYHRELLQRQLDDAERRIAIVERLIDSGGVMPYQIDVKDIADVRAVLTPLRLEPDYDWSLIDPAYQRVRRYLANCEVEPGLGMWISDSARDDWGEPFDFDLGFTVASQVPDGEGNECRTLPGGRFASTLHIGRYEEWYLAYQAIQAWLSENGHTQRGLNRQLVHVGPATSNDPATYVTEIQVPIA